MARQNISTPQILLNIPEYLASTGTEIDPIFRTLPVGTNSFTSASFTMPNLILGDKCFIAVLGHTLHTDNFNYQITTEDITYPDPSVNGTAEPTITTSTEELTPVINGTPASGTDGFSLSTFEAIGTNFSVAMEDQSDDESGTLGNIGSIIAGIYYDFPHSPDLKLSLSYEYGGIKEITTRGGSTLTNTFYVKPPYNWELGGDVAHAKSGRRIWDLSFSYLSDSSVFPTYASLYEEGSESYNNTLLDDDSLQRVIHLTNGGQLPFLFISDKDNIRKDNIAIAKFDMNSFKFDQVANSVYNIKLKIREVW